VVLLAEVDSGDAAVALERLRVRLAASVGSDRCPVTGSIGAVTFATVPEDLENMVQADDFRMYAAKAAGKDRLSLETVGLRG